MIRALRLALLVWPLYASLVACGSDRHSAPASNELGAGGVTQGSAGSEAQGGDPMSSTGGNPMSSTGGNSMSSTGGNPMSSTGGQGLGSGGANPQDPASGGTHSGNAGQGAGGHEGGSNGQGLGNGGATAEDGGADTAGSPAVEGLPGASDFTRFTVRRFESMPVHMDDCRDGFVSEWSFERATQMLTWNFCNVSEPRVESGSATLSDFLVQGILNALSFVEPALPEDDCFADVILAELELEVGGVTTVYKNASGCEPPPSDPSTLITMPGRLIEAVEWCSVVELPAMPDKLTLFSGTSPPPIGSDCSDPPYPLDYHLDLTTGSLTWTRCALDPETGETVEPRPSYGTVLDAAMLESVRSAYAELRLGVSGPCDSLDVPEPSPDGSVRAPRITIDDDLVVLDEVVSCAQSGWHGGAWAIGVAALTHLVEGVAQ